jgi:hypothetical protein
MSNKSHLKEKRRRRREEHKSSINFPTIQLFWLISKSNKNSQYEYFKLRFGESYITFPINPFKLKHPTEKEFRLK